MFFAHAKRLIPIDVWYYYSTRKSILDVAVKDEDLVVCMRPYHIWSEKII